MTLSFAEALSKRHRRRDHREGTAHQPPRKAPAERVVALVAVVETRRARRQDQRAVGDLPPRGLRDTSSCPLLY